MNVISFNATKRRRYPSGHETAMVDILVDGKPLAELIGIYEEPFARKEGHPKLAGDYHAIEISISCLDRYYLGEVYNTEGKENDKTIILGCSCGVAGCWPLLCKISLTESSVIWSDFEQPHRDEDWDYSRFEGFSFEKQQYLKCMNEIK